MLFITKFFRTLLFKKYDQFAVELGYPNWKLAEENTFFISRIPEDAQWNATQLPNKSWAIWNDEGQPPFSFQVYPTWEEAIKHLRCLFEKSGYPEENWDPEGFEPGDDVFISQPDKEKID
ncbi:hypothetical protein [Mesobacillus foraminis]|uniref:hypothetical protein n=1 Tax=Mesobacillus foraminis TaxID=279826 RepID=UPI000EF4E31F|nr:hypothetical protein [Mesobacillus foraminis]